MKEGFLRFNNLWNGVNLYDILVYILFNPITGSIILTLDLVINPGWNLEVFGYIWQYIN